MSFSSGSRTKERNKAMKLFAITITVILERIRDRQEVSNAAGRRIVLEGERERSWIGRRRTLVTTFATCSHPVTINVNILIGRLSRYGLLCRSHAKMNLCYQELCGLGIIVVSLFILRFAIIRRPEALILGPLSDATIRESTGKRPVFPNENKRIMNGLLNMGICRHHLGVQWGREDVGNLQTNQECESNNNGCVLAVAVVRRRGEDQI
ncbi:hypothetical protein KCU87_g155, partial [Aureobasidium melanogenum]